MPPAAPVMRLDLPPGPGWAAPGRFVVNAGAAGTASTPIALEFVEKQAELSAGRGLSPRLSSGLGRARLLFQLVVGFTVGVLASIAADSAGFANIWAVAGLASADSAVAADAKGGEPTVVSPGRDVARTP